MTDDNRNNDIPKGAGYDEVEDNYETWKDDLEKLVDRELIKFAGLLGLVGFQSYLLILYYHLTQ